MPIWAIYRAETPRRPDRLDEFGRCAIGQGTGGNWEYVVPFFAFPPASAR